MPSRKPKAKKPKISSRRSRRSRRGMKENKSNKPDKDREEKNDKKTWKDTVKAILLYLFLGLLFTAGLVAIGSKFYTPPSMSLKVIKGEMQSIYPFTIYTYNITDGNTTRLLSFVYDGKCVHTLYNGSDIGYTCQSDLITPFPLLRAYPGNEN